MNKFTLFIWLNLLTSLSLFAQTPLATTTHDIILNTTQNFGSVKTGVGYNPGSNLYYGNAAGVASYMFETFTPAGLSVAAVIGNSDMRGLWWNPLLSQLEYNTYGGAGIYQKTLDVNGYATATNVSLTVPNNHPDIQANAQYDWNNNHYIYYINGSITRVSRATNATVSTNAVTGLPAGTQITNWAIGYTGVTGYEIILYDYANKKAILINGATHAYAGATQLPATAISTTQYNVGYTNKRLFLYNTSDYKWYGYLIFPDNCTGVPWGGFVTATNLEVECGQTTNLTLNNATIANGITLQWQYNSGSGWTNFGTSNQAQTTPSIVGTTRFRCRVTCTSTPGGISFSDSLTITTRPVPLNIGNDTSICIGTTQSINATLGTGSSYLWNTNTTNATLSINAPDTYSVIVTQANGCISKDTIIVRAGIEPINNINAAYDLCEDSLLTLNIGNNNSTFLWRPTNATTPIIDVTTPGNYSVIVTTRDKCFDTFTTIVTERPRPVLNLPEEVSICSVDSILIDATTSIAATYNWQHGPTTSSIFAKNAQYYKVIATSSYGCPSWDSTLLVHYPDPTIDGFTYIPEFYDELGKVRFSIINPVSVTRYEWNFGDGATSTLFNPTHRYANLGTYTVTVTVYNDCTERTYTQNITIDYETGLKDLKQHQIAIYPNPSNQFVTIDNKGNEQLSKIIIYNAAGALITSQAITSSVTKVDVSHFTNGWYIVQIATNNGAYFYEKIEIQH